LFFEYALLTTKLLLIVFSFLIVARCLRSMLSGKYEPEVWAYLKYRAENIPVNHWENTIGRSASADVRIPNEDVSRIHAVLARNDKGVWRIFDIFSRGGVWVNGLKIGMDGLVLCDGDQITLGKNAIKFSVITTDKRKRLESQRTAAGRFVSPAITLVYLTFLQIVLVAQHALSLKDETYLIPVALGFLGIIALEWFCYTTMRLVYRAGFEPEILAFFLTTLGMSVTVSATPQDIYKQLALTYAAVILFLFLGWWLRNLKRVTSCRWIAAVLSLMLLVLNLFAGETIFGARNWLSIAGYSFQPSEFVKVGYIYVGASTLDRLYRKQNLFVFILFSAITVLALAVMGDFGTALIFFVCFLIISFLRSGSIATQILAVSGAGIAGLLAISVKPHIAQRFATWGHVWEDVFGAGYQQTHALSAAASGALLGKGAGSGWLKSITAAKTDMVFAVICEEFGLLIALCMVGALLCLALFTLRSAANGRSAYYSIAACAASSILLSQTMLNIFGSLDILPFTGVTFPFVSTGGSSLLCCWMLLSYIKSADNRRNASFAVNKVATIETVNEYTADEYLGGKADETH